MKRFLAMSRTKRIFVSILLVILVYLVYVIICATLPFMGSPDVNQEYKNNFNINSFFSDTVGIDRATVVETSQDALDVRLHMIEQADEEIAISSFSIKADQSCQEIAAVILAAANRGVKIKIIVDGLTGFIDMKDDPIYYVLGTHPNIEIRYYNMVNLLKPWTINGRLHDKYFLIDHKLLLLGGRNISDYFLGEYNLDALSYDRDILVYNTAFESKSNTQSVIFKTWDYFNTIWECEYSETVFNSVSSKKTVSEAEIKLENLYSTLKLERADILASIDYSTITVPTNKITLITNPIHIMTKQPYVWYNLTQLMRNAKERIDIQTPYAVLNDDMYKELSTISKLVPQFDMLLNSRAGGDNFCASSDYTFNQKKILKTGIKLHEFQGEYSMHDKSLLIDHDIAIIGSYNLDMRSTYLDTEVMLVVNGIEFNQQLESYYEQMKAQSLPVKSDGSYGENDDVIALPMSTGKKMLLGISSVFFQLFRYLL